MRRDLLDLLPADPDRSAPAQPPDNPAEEARSLSPYSGTAQERDDLERLAWIALEREVVDVPAPAPFGVEELVIDDVETDVDRVGQFWPTLVRIMSGIAVSEMTRMTTR